jgi:hypothetical protein
MDMNIYDESKGCFETKESIKVEIDSIGNFKLKNNNVITTIAICQNDGSTVALMSFRKLPISSKCQIDVKVQDLQVQNEIKR